MDKESILLLRQCQIPPKSVVDFVHLLNLISTLSLFLNSKMAAFKISLISNVCFPESALKQMN